MDPITAGFILSAIELGIKYGAPSAIAIIKAWDVEDPTLEDFEELKKRVPPSSAYFGEGEGGPSER